MDSKVLMTDIVAKLTLKVHHIMTVFELNSYVFELGSLSQKATVPGICTCIQNDKQWAVLRGGGDDLKTAVAGLDVGPCHPMLCNLHLGFQVCVCSGCFRVTLPFNRQ